MTSRQHQGAPSHHVAGRSAVHQPEAGKWDNKNMNDSLSPVQFAGPQLTVRDYEGRTGEPSHITRSETGLMPTAAVAGLRGASGERPGEHRNRTGEDWHKFKADVAANGIREPIFITVDHGQEPTLSEGNHRRDAAVELGHPHTPVEIRYFGHAEHQGSVYERHLAADREAGQ